MQTTAEWAEGEEVQVPVFCGCSEVLGPPHRLTRTSCYAKEAGSNHQGPRPENVQDLRSFLGILNYYASLFPACPHAWHH